MSDTPKNRSIVCCFCGDFWSYVEGVSDRDALIKIASEHEATCASNPYTTKIKQLKREIAKEKRRRDKWFVVFSKNLKEKLALSNQLIEMRKQRDTLAEIYPLLASAWFYGKWKAETLNEKEMQKIMEREGWYPFESEADLMKALATTKGGLHDA